MIPDKQSRASYTWELTASRCPLRIGLASFCCRTRWLLWRHTRRELEQKQEPNSYLHLKNSQFWPLVLLFFHVLSDPGFSEWCDYLTCCIVESTRIKPKYFLFSQGHCCNTKRVPPIWGIVICERPDLLLGALIFSFPLLAVSTNDEQALRSQVFYGNRISWLPALIIIFRL